MASTNTVKAFDKIQDLQWYSEHFLENSPYDLFKQIIDAKGLGHKDLLMIGEALLVFGQDDVDKERVQTFLATLEESEEHDYCSSCDCILRSDEGDICCSCEELQKKEGI